QPYEIDMTDNDDSGNRLMIPQGDGLGQRCRQNRSDSPRAASSNSATARTSSTATSRFSRTSSSSSSLASSSPGCDGGTARGSSNAGSIRSNQEVQMQADGIDFWVVRKGEDAYKVAPEVADEILEHPNDGVCLFCGDGHKISAVIGFRWRVDAGVCVR